MAVRLAIYREVRKTVNYGSAWNATLLDHVPPGVTTRTYPLVAPAGPAAEMAEPDELTANAAAVPLKATLVCPTK